MDRREQALLEAITKNAEETEKWTKYREDHKQAEDNLKTFGKSLEVDVMVPIGSKALIPGKLVHTNEVFVSHFRGIFSKCSAFQAQKIIDHRLGVADKQLELLKTERELFENKLWVPHSDGALPNQGEHEIVEEYDEEKEKVWRERHRQSVREEKLKEKSNRDQITGNSSESDIMNMLEERELIEELENDLEEMQVEDEDTLRQLMAGEIKPQEKRRVAHSSEKKQNNLSDVQNEPKSSNEFSIEELAEKYKTCKITENHVKQDYTNNNLITNSEDFDDDVSDTSDTSSTSEIPQEVLDMEKDISNMNKGQKIEFYEKQIKNYEKKIDSMIVRDLDGMNEKMNYIEIRDYLLDYLEIIRDEIETEDDEPKSLPVEKKKKTKRITFAEEDQIKYIDKNDSVADMFKKNERDVIQLDPEFQVSPVVEPHVIHSTLPDDKKKAILEKVEKNFETIRETQSQSDFNLVDKIINSDSGKSRTLQIKFKHSENKPVVWQNADDTIGSPVDIYARFVQDHYSGTDDQKNINISPILKECDRIGAYEDIRSNYSLPNRVQEMSLNSISKDSTVTKSILKKREPLEQIAQDSSNNTIKPQQKKKKPSRDDISCPFDLIMGDVIENPITEPEPLPKENFVDALTPKKRISRFKQQRAS